MPVFKLKPVDELVESDFVEHPFWACYYEPEDMDALVHLGFELEEVQKEMQMVEFSDAYAFALPNAAVDSEFKYLYVSARFTTPAGKTLVGYVHGPAFAVYLGGQRYVFNRQLPEFWRNAERDLRAALDADAFPLECVGVVDGRRATIEDVR